jgi:hypothetical protein
MSCTGIELVVKLHYTMPKMILELSFKERNFIYENIESFKKCKMALADSI